MFITNFSAAVLLATLSPTSGTPAPRTIGESVARIAEASDESALVQKGFSVSPKREGFFSAPNLLVGVLLFGSAIADAESTFACLDASPRCVEGNPHRANDIARGRSATYATEAAVAVPTWVISHYLRRSDHRSIRILGWAFPLTLSGVRIQAAINNIKLKNELLRTP